MHVTQTYVLLLYVRTKCSPSSRQGSWHAMCSASADVNGTCWDQSKASQATRTTERSALRA